jgi:hypothetical protein
MQKIDEDAHDDQFAMGLAATSNASQQLGKRFLKRPGEQPARQGSTLIRFHGEF